MIAWSAPRRVLETALQKTSHMKYCVTTNSALGRTKGNHRTTATNEGKNRWRDSTENRRSRDYGSIAKETMLGEVQTFSMKVTGTFKDDAMLQQITEAIQIENADTNTLINT